MAHGHTVTRPDFAHTAPAQLSVGVLIDRDISDRPSLPTILGNKIARSAILAEGSTVVRVGHVHDQGGVEVVVLGNGAAFGLLAFHGWVVSSASAMYVRYGLGCCSLPVPQPAPTPLVVDSVETTAPLTDTVWSICLVASLYLSTKTLVLVTCLA